MKPPDGHWHRRGKPVKPTNATWGGWVRCPCTEKGCDWAVYIDPKGHEHVGYIPSPDRPGNVIDPADVTAVAARRRVITEVGSVNRITGEIEDT